jgi:hypothetical protein
MKLIFVKGQSEIKLRQSLEKGIIVKIKISKDQKTKFQNSSLNNSL